jgi:hypothetical protein
MVCFTESQKPRQIPHVKSLYKNPRNSAYNDAATAASVGEPSGQNPANNDDRR